MTSQLLMCHINRTSALNRLLLTVRSKHKSFQISGIKYKENFYQGVSTKDEYLLGGHKHI